MEMRNIMGNLSRIQWKMGLYSLLLLLAYHIYHINLYRTSNLKKKTLKL